MVKTKPSVPKDDGKDFPTPATTRRPKKKQTKKRKKK